MNGLSRFKHHQTGYILIPIVLAISILALLAYWLNQKTSMQMTKTATLKDIRQAYYVAHAGLAHGKWLLRQNSSCSDFKSPSNINFSDHAYSITISPSSGSPVTITATSTLKNGLSRSVSSTVAAYGAQTIYNSAVVEDTYLRSNAQTTNYGSWSNILLSNGWFGKRNILIRHSATSLINKPMLIESAYLRLYLNSTASAAANVSAHAITTSGWDESQATWNQYATGLNWGSPGGDYSSSILDTTYVSGFNTGWYAWNITDTVTGWLLGGAVNNGLLLTTSAYMFDILYFTSEQGSSSQDPEIRITYRCECGQTC